MTYSTATAMARFRSCLKAPGSATLRLVMPLTTGRNSATDTTLAPALSAIRVSARAYDPM